MTKTIQKTYTYTILCLLTFAMTTMIMTSTPRKSNVYTTLNNTMDVDIDLVAHPACAPYFATDPGVQGFQAVTSSITIKKGNLFQVPVYYYDAKNSKTTCHYYIQKVSGVTTGYVAQTACLFLDNFSGAEYAISQKTFDNVPPTMEQHQGYFTCSTTPRVPKSAPKSKKSNNSEDATNPIV